MRILVVGNGGREHALLWKLGRDAPSADLYATRPNGGMEPLCTAVPIAPTDVEALAGWAASRQIDLVVVGPEAPLAMGLADRCRKHGVPVFGPSAAAARIEASKAFAKDLMREAGVPTAAYRTFTDAGEAEAYVRERGAPIVVKASGLAAGKGAVVCETVDHAVATARAMLEDRRFGEAGREVVVEDFMEGEELSVFAVTDGEEALLLLPSQDHKRAGEGDTGPNTGGMGAYAPVSLATPGLLVEVRERILLPTLEALAAADAPFRGVLYAGLMLTPDGPSVVEFNCRLGDPEAQAVLPLMDSSLLEPMMAVALGDGLAGSRARWRPGAALTTVLASGGYPGDYPTGLPIRMPADLEDDGDVVVFHAGTRRTEGGLETAGGRVLAVTGLGEDLEAAARRSRQAAASVAFEGMQHRDDIGWRELERQGAARSRPAGSAPSPGATS
ncbi:MAG: phosphoribosylamine--glycine ligase [Gemmatimonadetes bacterium]|nr:phosphoribosylamine--glycine ligase [Gemmatimonadota bacterium]